MAFKRLVEASRSVLPKDKEQLAVKLEKSLYPFLDPKHADAWFQGKVGKLPPMVRFVKSPYYIPELGGSRGALTRLVRQMPITYATCWDVAGFIAASIPDVQIEIGLYRLNQPTVQKKIASDDLKHREYHGQLLDQMKTTIRHYRNFKKNAWTHTKKTHPNFPIYIDKEGLPWTIHVWNSYNGVHFDALCRTLFSPRWHRKPNWFNSTEQTWVHWVEYRSIKSVNLDSVVKAKGFDEIETSAYRWFCVRKSFAKINNYLEAFNQYQNQMKSQQRKSKFAPTTPEPELLGFRLPITTQWMRDKKPYPTV
jgi:hypothetical protein